MDNTIIDKYVSNMLEWIAVEKGKSELSKITKDNIMDYMELYNKRYEEFTESTLCSPYRDIIVERMARNYQVHWQQKGAGK